MRREELQRDASEALRIVSDETLSRAWVGMPAIVVAVNFDAQTVDVQPAIRGSQRRRDNSVESVDLPIVPDVPIVWQQVNGFALTFPIASGDQVWLLSSSRCIENWWATGQVQDVARGTLHELGECVAIAGPSTLALRMSAISTRSVQLRNRAGSAFVEVDDGGNVRAKTGSTLIEITPAGVVNIYGPTAINAKSDAVINVEAPTINATAAQAINAQAPTIAIAAQLLATITAPTLTLNSPNITFPTADGLAILNAHRHKGVQSGSSNSGSPVP